MQALVRLPPFDLTSIHQTPFAFSVLPQPEDKAADEKSDGVPKPGKGVPPEFLQYLKCHPKLDAEDALSYLRQKKVDTAAEDLAAADAKVEQDELMKCDVCVFGWPYFNVCIRCKREKAKDAKVIVDLGNPRTIIIDQVGSIFNFFLLLNHNCR